MGYCIHQRDARFRIKKENFEKALEAIKALGALTDKMNGGSFGVAKEPERWFSWVSMQFVNSSDIADAMKHWRWEVMFGEPGYTDSLPTSKYNPDKDVVFISFCGEKMGDDTVLFSALAPFVEDGSYIEMQGEEGEIWRWTFVDGKLKEVSAKILWE
jgi:hypothetical protein